MKLSLQQIKSISSNDTVYQRGVAYFNDGNIISSKSEAGVFRGDVIIKSLVEGAWDSYKVEITLDDDGSCIYECACPAYRKYPGACKHIVATLIDYLRNSKLPKQAKSANVIPIRRKASEPAVNLMLRTYSDAYEDESITYLNKTKYELVPKIEFDYAGSMYISLSILGNRKYIIKCINQFCDNIHTNQYHEYGKHLGFTHSKHVFDEKSICLIEWMMNKYYYPKLNKIPTYATRYLSKETLKTLEITIPMIDDFFDIYAQDEISYDGASAAERSLKLWDDPPEITLSLEKNGDDEVLIQSEDMTAFKLTQGEKYSYLSGYGYMHRCSKEFGEKIKPLNKAFRNRYTPLQMSIDDMGKFYANVINQISPFVHIRDKDDFLDTYKPVPLIGKIYLDTPYSSEINAKVIMCYGEYERNAFLEHENITIIQNILQERKILSNILSYFDAPISVGNPLYTIKDEDIMYEFLTYGLGQFDENVEIYASDKFNNLSLEKRPNLSVGVSLNNDWLDISIDTGLFPIEELHNALNAYRENKKYFRLKSGSFIDMQDSGLDQLANMTDLLSLKKSEINAGHAQVEKFRAMQIDSIIKNNEYIVARRDSSFRRMVKDLGDVYDGEYEIPKQLENILRSYQREGYQWLKTMEHYGFCGILADDMGLGKTIQVISLMLDKKNNNIPCLSLVVCPASLVLNWQYEIEKFAPSIKTLSILGSAQRRHSLLETTHDYDVIITSYDLLKRDIEKYSNHVFDYHIIDEAQYIKNPRTKNSQCVKKIKSKQRFALTGTPLENRLSDLWSIFDFLMRGYMYSYSHFKREFETPIVKLESDKPLANLNQMTKPFILRRLKKDVLKELPDKIQSVIEVSMGQDQLKLYMANAASAKEQFFAHGDKSGKDKIMILALLTKLRQLCCDPRLVYDNYNKHSSKLEACIELVETIIDSNHKILLFSQFTSMLSLIQDEFAAKGISYYLLKGSTPKHERAKLCEAFNNDDTNVFLISLKAGGTGLNLTGADVVIHYDPWWNEAAQRQATDRAHRIGQKSVVQVYKLITQNSIEEKILMLQERKTALADSIIHAQHNVLSGMSVEDLLDLF